MNNKKTDRMQIVNIDDLKCFLIEQAYSSQRLYHYTTYESLLTIINGKSLRLSRLDLLNDKAELKLGFHDDVTNNYVISFTNKKEYVSMWAMYGKPSGIKLRLDFNTSAFIKCINNLFYDSQKSNSITKKKKKKLFNIPSDSFDQVQLSDVVYLDKDSMRLRHDGRLIKELSADDKIIKRMTGFIKYDAWEFEKETRLRVRLHENRDMKICNNRDYIYCGISDDLIKSFRITFNPWMSPLLKEEVRKSLCSVSGYEIQCKDSDDDGEISEL